MHLFDKLQVVDTDERTADCGTGKITAKHVIQDRLTFLEQRTLLCLAPAPFENRLRGDASNLKFITSFIISIKLTIIIMVINITNTIFLFHVHTDIAFSMTF